MSWLRIKSEPLAELYEGAVELTYGTSIPGRLRLVCHAVREIRNRLPDQFTSTKGELTYHARIQQLRQLWSAHGLPLALDSKAGTLRLEEDPVGVAVPVVQALLSLFTDDQAVEGKNRERTWDMFAALTAEEPADREELEPIVHHWLAATEWFMQRAHESGKPIDPADDAELPDRFAALEAALESMVGGFFTAVQELDEILNDPRTSRVSDAVARLGRAQQRRYFFDRLRNPEWITPLQNLKFFDSPPRPIAADGGLMFPSWPQSQWLARMASQRPEAVMRVICAMPDTENVFVQADILDAAIASPANLSLPLVPLVRRWLGSNYRSMIPRKTASLAVHLARSGELDQALKLMRQLLFFGVHEQVIEPELGGGVHADAYPKIAAWDYQEIASHEAVELAGVVGMRALEVFCKTLSAAIASTTGRNTRNGEDLSSIWCPSVEEATGQGAQVVLNALVVGIRGAALLLVERSQASVGQILSTLQHFKWRIFQRLALHVLRSVTSDQIGLVAASLGNRALFESSGTRHEYDLLLQDWFGELDEHQRRQILRWAMRPNLNSRRARYRRRSGVKSSPELEARWKAYWQRDRLAPIAAMLPPYWSHRYDRLVAELGSSDFPRARTEVISWVGSLSPKTAAELDKMEMAEIADFLRNWDAPSELAWGPTQTADGLAQELAQSVKKRPLEFSKFAEQFQDCRSEYAGAILTGLTEAAREGTALDWESILGLAGSVVARVSEEDQGSLSGDVWSWRGRQVAGLLSTGLESTAGQIPSELRGSVWDCIAALARHSNPTPEHEVEFGGSNMDPSTLSINTVRGEALHAAIRYGLWLRRLGLDGGQLAPELAELLDQHLDLALDESSAIRSIYGQWFPWLMLLGQEWAVRNRARIFPPNAAGHDQWAAAWTAYVVFNQPHDNVWPLLRDEYRFALEHLDWQPARTSIVGSPVARLAEHLMLAYLRGELSLDDELLSALFASSEASIRRHAISFVGRVLGNGDTLPSDLIKRAIDLWEHRLGCAADCPQDACLVEEIEEFGWWFASGTLDIRWALQQLHAALSLSPSSKPEHQVVQQLAVYAPDQPEFAIQCISLLVRDGRHAWQLSSWRQSMREIIVAALTSTADASRCAQQLVNELGRKGFIDDFRDLAA